MKCVLTQYECLIILRQPCEVRVLKSSCLLKLVPPPQPHPKHSYCPCCIHTLRTQLKQCCNHLGIFTMHCVKIQSLIHSCIRLEHSGSAQKGRQQCYSCHCEALRAHPEMRCSVIIGGSCHKYYFCCNKFLVMTSLLLLRQTHVYHHKTHLLS